MAKDKKQPAPVATEEETTAMREAYDGMLLYGAHPAVQTAVKTEIERLFKKLGLSHLAEAWNKVVWSGV